MTSEPNETDIFQFRLEYIYTGHSSDNIISHEGLLYIPRS